MKKRSLIATTLIKKFSNDYTEVMKLYGLDEKIELTKYLLNVINTYLEDKEPTRSQLKLINDELDTIKKKYGQNFKAFRNAQFHKYFLFDIILAEKGIYSDKEYLRLNPQSLKDLERKGFLIGGRNLLQNSLDNLYLGINPQRPEILNGTKVKKSKGKIKRTKGDNYTFLNEDQTALLVAHLRQFNVFLKGDNCNLLEAGEAVNILTGYSVDTIRQDLGKPELMETKENKDKVKLILNRMYGNIDKGLTEDYR